jgi:hypothetical protein
LAAAPVDREIREHRAWGEHVAAVRCHLARVHADLDGDRFGARIFDKVCTAVPGLNSARRVSLKA